MLKLFTITATTALILQLADVAQAELVPVLEDESVYGQVNDPNFNLDATSFNGGLFSGVDGGFTPTPARFYLKFQLPPYEKGTEIDSATLTGFYYDDYNINDNDLHGIYFVSSDTWSESTITWNNQPGQAFGLSETSFDAAQTSGRFVNFDLTRIVNQEYKGDGVVSLLVHANQESVIRNNQNWEYFVEKEFDSTKAFRLEVESADEMTQVPEASAILGLILFSLGSLHKGLNYWLGKHKNNRAWGITP